MNIFLKLTTFDSICQLNHSALMGWYYSDALMLLMCWCCAADAADALMLLMHWCTDTVDALMLLMRWCCWFTDAADALILLMLLLLLSCFSDILCIVQCTAQTYIMTVICRKAKTSEVYDVWEERLSLKAKGWYLLVPTVQCWRGI